MRTSLLFAASFAALLYPRAAHATGSLNVADVSSLQNFGYGSSTIADRRLAYDRLVALTSIQGIVNRTSPELYLVFNQPIDELWLTRLQGAEMGGGLLTGRTVQRLNKAVSQTATVAAQMSEIDVAIDSVLKTYSSQLKGLAVWDENVPSTLNAAFTAAGVDDLIVVRFDKDPASLYQKLLAKGFTAKVSLVNADGSSLFVNGSTNVPGLTSGLSHKSSGRAKADAYLWASETYLKTKKTKPTEFGMMVDGIWVKDPLYANNGGASPLNLWYVTNHDWLVAERGFPFDFNPLSTTVASDDPGAPAGLDLTVQNEILLNARALAGSEVISIRGFIPWPYKYQTGGNPVDLEWASVKNISPFAAGLDADAYAPSPQISNATIFSQVPLPTTPEPQVRPTAEDLVGNGFLTGLANNGGFEDDGAEWTTGTTNCTVYADPTKSRTGMKLMQCNTVSSDNLPSSTIYRSGAAVGAGGTVVGRTFLRSSGGPYQVTQVVRAIGGTEESTTTTATIGADWTEVRTTLSVTKAAHTGTRLEIYLGTNGKNLDIDDSAFYAGDPANASVVPANYTLWLLGDHDSAAWYYSVLPHTWDAPGRGLVPFAWDFSGHPAPRIPPHFRHVVATRTNRDFFIGGDSGPGYANPSAMGSAARAMWADQGVRDARYLDTSAGWILDPIDPLKLDHMGAVTPYYGDGVLVGPYLPAGSFTGMAGNTPVIALRAYNTPTNAGFGKVAAADLVAAVVLNAPAPTVPTFIPYRVVALSDLTASVSSATAELVASHADKKIRAVDPFTFFYLARRQAGGHNTYRASYKSVKIPTTVDVGDKVTMTWTVHNDGWETWVHDGPNPVRVGVSVVDGAPSARVPPSYSMRVDLPSDVGPGQEVALSLELPAYAVTGAHTVQIDMVQELKTWFEAQGDIPLLSTFNVVVPVTQGGDGGSGATLDGGIGAGPNGAGNALGDGDGEGGCACRSAAPATAGHAGRWAVLGAALLLFRRRKKHANPTDSW